MTNRVTVCLIFNFVYILFSMRTRILLLLWFVDEFLKTIILQGNVVTRFTCGDRWDREIYLPARRYASAGNRHSNVSVCLSVCPSVTRRYCVKTKKASGMISLTSGSSKTLVFWHQISSPNSKGFPRTGASNKGRSEKFSDFLALSVNISKTVADTAKVTISD